MTTDDMKAAIERAMSEGMANQREWWLICELAEVGRLAVKARIARTKWLASNEIGGTTLDADIALTEAVGKRNAAADAFLAKHGGGG